ncbi:MAG: hypothetical protein KatS3mg131_0169 [Candidatus Tectimicrobiota bacterium]|nr:MAG: hypothetical protein KatS3mg131_0169 [Candidatus Tectomicrobia bacterium]
MTAEQLLCYRSVQTWLQGLQQQSGVPPQACEERLRLLAAFCAYVGQSPDALVAACLRHTEAGTAIDAAGRRRLAAQIAAFAQQLPGDRRQQVFGGNVVRSFLIHNGIMLQAGWPYRPQA